jgi:chromosomal replication initiator protein
VVDGVVTIPVPGQLLSCDLGPHGDLNSPFSLPVFLAGPENGLAEVGMRAVLEDRPRGYSPLLLYGPSGSGKSHLARGLAAERRRMSPSQRVVCITAVDFAQRLAEAIDTQATDDLRERYRKADLLVIEDIGELGDQRAAQEELIPTFDALLQEDKWLMVTASAPPSALPQLLPALRGRLVGGLSIPLALPRPATRRVILRRLAELRRIDLSEPAAQILANGISSTVPELFEVLMELAGLRQGNASRVDAQTVRWYLANRRGPKEPRLHDIALATARYFSLEVSDLRSRSRRQEVVTARGVAAYLARQLTGQSLDQIGCYFGGRDRTTVMHGYRKTENLMKTNSAIRQAVAQLQEKW